MDIIATHANTDFDALASLVAGTLLYPSAMGILPSQLRSNVKQFLSLHRDLFRLVSIKDLNLEKVSRLIAVDTNNWSRLDRLAKLKERPGLEIHLWDHHMHNTDIEPSWRCHEEAGATITLMLREIRKRDCAFSPMHATLFLMGIYEDTGNLTYPSTTPEDGYSAGFLLKNGADLNVVSAYLSSPFDDLHTSLLKDMLDSLQTFKKGGCEIGVAFLPVESGMSMLSSVVVRCREIRGLDALFGVFSVQGAKYMVIGCAGIPEVDVGAIVRRLGGGGHPGAGSALIRSEDVNSVRARVLEQIEAEMEKPKVSVRDIMSQPEVKVSPSTPIGEVCALLETLRARAVLVMHGDEFCGLLSTAECSKARMELEGNAPVKAFMRTRIPVIHPDQATREALRLMSDAQTSVLPVVEDGSVIGVVTRPDLLLHIYKF